MYCDPPGAVGIPWNPKAPLLPAAAPNPPLPPPAWLPKPPAPPASVILPAPNPPAPPAGAAGVPNPVIPDDAPNPPAPPIGELKVL